MIIAIKKAGKTSDDDDRRAIRLAQYGSYLMPIHARLDATPSC